VITFKKVVVFSIWMFNISKQLNKQKVDNYVLPLNEFLDFEGYQLKTIGGVYQNNNFDSIRFDLPLLMSSKFLCFDVKSNFIDFITNFDELYLSEISYRKRIDSISAVENRTELINQIRHNLKPNRLNMIFFQDLKDSRMFESHMFNKATNQLGIFEYSLVLPK